VITEVTEVVMPPTALVAVVTTAGVVPSSCVGAEVTGAVMLPAVPLSEGTVPPSEVTVPPSEDTVPVPVVTTWVRAEVTGAVTAETVPVTDDVTVFPEEATCVTVEDTGEVTVATLPVRDDVRALPVATFPTVCVAADVAPDTVDVTAEAGALVVVAGALVDAVVLAAGAADADPEPAAVETVDWLVETAWPTAEDTPAATEEVLVAAPPPEPLWAVVAPGLVAAEADLAVRRDSPIATPMAARAMPAAHRQNRRTLVTSPLVTTVTLIRSGHPV
jgi:hypothetical protein